MENPDIDDQDDDDEDSEPKPVPRPEYGADGYELLAEHELDERLEQMEGQVALDANALEQYDAHYAEADDLERLEGKSDGRAIAPRIDPDPDAPPDDLPF